MPSSGPWPRGFGLQPSQIKQKSNAHANLLPPADRDVPRQRAHAASLPEIGRAFGGKHHTTVLHSIQKIEKLRAEGPGFEQIDPQPNRFIPLDLHSFPHRHLTEPLWNRVDNCRHARVAHTAQPGFPQDCTRQEAVEFCII